jgi:hypothetical protein
MFKPTEKTYLLLAFNSISLAVFALCYPYAEAVGMNYLDLHNHPIISAILSVISVLGLGGFVAFFIWFIISIIQDWLAYKRGELPKDKYVIDETKMTPKQIIAHYEGLTKLEAIKRKIKG